MNTPKKPQQAAQTPPPNRTFSAEFKRAIVKDIQNKLVTVQQVAEEYDVSRTSVYRWMQRYSITDAPKRSRVVLELDSQQYQTKQLRQRLLELEATLGRKQLLIDYLNELVAVSSVELGIDLKKTFDSMPSPTSDNDVPRRTGR